MKHLSEWTAEEIEAGLLHELVDEQLIEFGPAREPGVERLVDIDQSNWIYFTKDRRLIVAVDGEEVPLPYFDPSHHTDQELFRMFKGWLLLR